MNDRLSKRNLWSFSLGTVGRDMAAAGLFTNYLLNYVLFTKTLTAAQFTVITVIMMAARFFDALIDPIIGNMIDARQHKYGKFKPFILIGAIATAIVVSLSFTNNLQGWGYVLFFGVMYFLFSISFSINDISYWGMLPSLTTSQDGRNRLTSLTALMAGIGAFLCGLLVPMFTVGEHVIGGSAVVGYGVIAVIFSIIMLLTQGITLVGVQEKLEVSTEPVTKISVKEILKVILQNKQALWSGIILFIYMMVSTMSTTLISTFLYLSFGYDGLLVTIFNIVGQLAGALVFILFPVISKRLKRAQLIRIAASLSVVGYAGILLLGILLPDDLEVGKLVVLAVLNILPSVGNGVFYLIIMINIANAVEYNEWKFGKRNEGIIFSVRPFMTQLGMGLGQFATMAVYLIVGILATTNQISTLENAAARGTISGSEKFNQIQQIIQQTPGAKSQWLLLFLTLIPLGGIIGCYQLYMKKQLVSEQEFSEIVRDLEERRRHEQ